MTKKILILFTALALAGCTLNSTTKQDSNISPVPTDGQALTGSPSKTTKDVSTYTLSDIAPHNNEQDCWLVVGDSVYDVTSFIPSHPGGQEILRGCGKDATQLFSSEREHSEQNAMAALVEYRIGAYSK